MPEIRAVPCTLRVLFFCCSGYLFGQAWSGIVRPDRGVDWSKRVVVGGIPTRTTVCSSVESRSFGFANQFRHIFLRVREKVHLNAGTYNLSGGVVCSSENQM